MRCLPFALLLLACAEDPAASKGGESVEPEPLNLPADLAERITVLRGGAATGSPREDLCSRDGTMGQPSCIGLRAGHGAGLGEPRGAAPDA